MIESLTFILLGLILLYLGGEGLVRGSSALALRLGLTPLVVGLTVGNGVSVRQLTDCVYKRE